MTSTANAATSFSTADPLTRQPLGERPVYATGMLLDAQDFLDEQTYHRSQLARALGAVAGSGTLAGLRVQHRPAVGPGPGERPEEIQVNAGLAVDRLGRLIELPRPACLRLQRWWDTEAARSNLRQADYASPERFISARARAAATPLARAVVADVFLRFVACPRGLTPAFASGPFDALNAVSVSRLRDAYELHLVPRQNLSDTALGLPLRAGAFTLPVTEETAAEALTREAAMDDPAADSAVRRAALQDAVLNGYHRTADELPRGPEHPPTVDASAVFIARVLIPVDPLDPTQRQGNAVLVDNHSRRFLPGLGVLARWTGL
jgi:hypothetical protein